ncbi:hypothetical protein DFH08DRAFT_956526 [Mycena albidolilacea]|uniref:Uncharacterized protein n=1 Tax=Mycena albidolilacea TaxID=1033008 RepID=A0AAD7AAG3_9AGAR|nr:hypothetical protein DFH08DRAFT_956526 [Mycena albidolilacea]
MAFEANFGLSEAPIPAPHILAKETNPRSYHDQHRRWGRIHRRTILLRRRLTRGRCSRITTGIVDGPYTSSHFMVIEDKSRFEWVSQGSALINGRGTTSSFSTAGARTTCQIASASAGVNAACVYASTAAAGVGPSAVPGRADTRPVGVPRTPACWGGPPCCRRSPTARAAARSRSRSLRDSTLVNGTGSSPTSILYRPRSRPARAHRPSPCRAPPPRRHPPRPLALAAAGKPSTPPPPPALLPCLKHPQSHPSYDSCKRHGRVEHVLVYRRAVLGVLARMIFICCTMLLLPDSPERRRAIYELLEQ